MGKMELMNYLQSQFDNRLPVEVEEPLKDQAREISILSSQLSHYADQPARFAEILAEIHEVSAGFWEAQS